MATVNALGLPKESAFRDTEQVPYPEKLLCPSIQTTTQNKEKDSLSTRELVEKIDSYAEVIELDTSINPTPAEDQVLPSALLNPNL